MKIAIHTHYTYSYEPLAAIVIPNLQKYADKYKYDLHIEKYPDGNVDFVKTKTALKLLEDYDLVFCLECDMMVMNHTIKAESFIDDKHSFFICADVNNINGGSFIAKNNNYTRLFLEQTNNPEYGFKTEQNYWEANAVNHPDVKILPHPSINSIPYKYYHNYGYINYNWQPEPTHEQGNFEVGDFICHLPGMPLEKRIEIFNELKQYIIYE